MSHPIVHCEIGCKNSEKLKDFYADLFGWGFQSYGNAQMFDTQVKEGMPGINGHINALGHEPHNYVIVYVQTDDIEASLKKVESLGGKRMIPKTEVPTMGHFAWFTDPEGTMVGLWTPMQQG